MSPLRDRHLVGGAAAACAVCCAAPVIGLLGLAGIAATTFTFVLAGLAFALVVGGISLAAVLVRRTRQTPTCEPDTTAVAVELEPTRHATEA